MAKDAQLTRTQAARALNACLAGIQAGLAKGDRVTISGFGSFGVSQRKPRTLRNPRNGEAIAVEARRVARFAPGNDLRSAIQNNGSATGSNHHASHDPEAGG